MLITYSEKTGPSTATVSWRSGAENSGVIEITLPYDSLEVAIIAELVAINHLVLDKKVLGSNVIHGSGLELQVSKGAIRKIINRKSDKKDVVKFASFIDFLLKGITIKTHKKCREDIAPNLENLERITVDIERYTNTRILIDTPSIGCVEITNHSVDRYYERSNEESGEVKHPLKSLINRLSHPDLKQVKVPENVLSHKERKYGRSDDYSAWKHPTSSLNFGLLKKGDVYFLVTVFINKNQELKDEQ